MKNEVTITIKSNGRTVTANCGKLSGTFSFPADKKFDLFKGAEIALKRLKEEAEKEYQVAIDSCTLYLINHF